jgi:hypothetical protein
MTMPLDYSAGAPNAPEPQPGTVPTYPDLVRGASALRGLADLVWGFGWLSIIGGGFWFGAGLFGYDWGDRVVGMILVVSGVVDVVAAAVLRMLGAAALALRDMAINSFYK